MGSLSFCLYVMQQFEKVDLKLLNGVFPFVLVDKSGMKHEHRDATLQLLTKRPQIHSLLTFLTSSSLPAALTSPLLQIFESVKQELFLACLVAES